MSVKNIVYVSSILGIIFINESISAQCTETQITVDGSNHWNPEIYGDKIVWYDDRNGSYDIYMSARGL